MAVNVEANAEPIPGYRLIDRLGGGGFGEVWKAVAPGGLHKAIKFVYGFLDSNDEDAARAEQELRALERVKFVRHSYILGLDRIDKVDGQLLIVMELADRTLWDRFKECRSEGLVGIPRAELLRYMKEAAEALDFMYSRYQLLHLDVKPQNLFLVETHIKVADFGLTKNLTGSAASITGGVTPVYAAPETFDGEGRGTTDQYSLAIVYQEMLTGQRPFSGTTARQLVLQHLQAEPDLSALPPADQAILRRALNKDYRERFASCMAFAQALESAQAERGPAVAVPDGRAGSAAPPAGAEPTEAHTAGPPAKSRPSLPSLVTDQPPHSRPASQLLDRLPISATREPSPDANTEAATLRPASLPEIPQSVRSAELRASSSPSQSTAHLSHRTPPDGAAGDGILLPALVVGIGSLGQAALKQLRRQVRERFGVSDSLPHVRTLYLDADPEALALAARGGPFALHNHEIQPTRLHRASHYLKPKDGGSHVQSWLPTRMLYRIPRQLVPDGVRALGRLAFVDNYELIRRRLETELKACTNRDHAIASEKKTGLSVCRSNPRVYVITSLAGGTGSGMFIDVGYAVRRLLREAGVAEPDVVGVLLLPETEGGAEPPSRATPALANTFAALTELQHFGQDGGYRTPAEAKDARASAGDRADAQGPPFARCLLVPCDAEPGAASDEFQTSGMLSAPGVVRAANLLFTELCTPLGREIDRERRKWLELLPRRAGGVRGGGVVYQTADLMRIHWPYQQVRRRAALRLCQRLVQHWMNKDARPLRESISQWVQTQWAELELSANQLIERLQLGCEQALGQDPTALLGRVLEPLAPYAGAPARSAKPGREGEVVLPLSVVVEVLEGLEPLLGVPEGCQGHRPTSAVHIGKLDELLREAVAGLVRENEGRIAELVVRLIEEPEFRLAGAEETLRQFSGIVQRALENQEELTREMQERAALLYGKIHALLENPEKNAKDSSWLRTIGRRSSGRHPQHTRELVEALQAYPKCLFQSLVLQQVQSFYVSLRGQLSDQLREVDFCRGRLGELGGKFQLEIEADSLPASAAEQLLLPEGCRTIDDAVNRALAEVASEEFLALDHQVERVIRRDFRALVHVCMASSSLLRALLPQMLDETEHFLDSRLPAADAAAMYLQRLRKSAAGGQAPDDAVVSAALRAAYDEAQPTLLGSSDEDSVCVLGTPDSPQAEPLRRLARQCLPRTRVQFAPTADEIVLYREQLHTSLSALQQLTRRTRPAYEQVAGHEHLTPHSRLDIANWAPLCG